MESAPREELEEFLISYNTAELSEDEFSDFFGEYLPHGYTEDETREIFTIGNHIDTLRVQYLALPANVAEVMSMDIQLGKAIPILALHSAISDEEDVTQDDINGHEQYIKRHLEKLGEVKRHTVMENSSHQDIYNNGNFRKLICEEVEAFVDNL
jgi:hypothetical protein